MSLVPDQQPTVTLQVNCNLFANRLFQHLTDPLQRGMIGTIFDYDDASDKVGKQVKYFILDNNFSQNKASIYQVLWVV